ncbi:MAG: transporter substrate-binding domain-containing protein [Acetivibrio sp.]
MGDLKKRYQIYLIVMIILCFSRKASAEDNTLKVLLPGKNSEGYVKEENGEFSGYYIEYLDKIADYTGWKYEYEVAKNQEDLLKKMESGKYDLIPGLKFSEEYDKKYVDYPMISTASKRSVLSVKKDNSTIKKNDYRSLQGIKIAVSNQNFDMEIRLKNFCLANGIPYVDDSKQKYPLGINFIHMKEEDCYRKCTIGAVDGILTTDSYALGHKLAVAYTFGREPLYFAVGRGEKGLASQLNQVLPQIQTLDPGYEERLYDKYFSENQKWNLRFNRKELAFLRKGATYKVAMLFDAAPYSYIEKGEERGIFIEALKQIQDRTFGKIQFEYVFFTTTEGIVNALNDGRCDISAAVLAPELQAKVKNPERSVVYYRDKFTIYKNRHSNKEMKSGKTVVPYGFVKEKNIAKELLEEENIDTVGTTRETLKDLNEGKADYGIILNNIGSYYIDYCNFNNIVNYKDLDEEFLLSLTFSAEKDEILIDIVNKCLEDIPVDFFENYFLRALVNEEGDIPFHVIIQNNLSETISIITLLLVLLVFIVILGKKNKELFNANTSKKEFLSSMSHEMRTPLNVIMGLNQLIMEDPSDWEKTKEYGCKIETASKHLLSIINDVLDMSKISEGKMRLNNQIFNLQETISMVSMIQKVIAEENEITMETKIELPHPYVIGDELRIKQVLINLIANAIKYNKSKGHVDIEICEIETEEENSIIRFLVKDTGYGILEEDKKEIFQPFERLENGKTNIQGTGLGLSISQKIVNMMGSEIQLESVVGKGSSFWFDLHLRFTQVEETSKSEAEGLENLLEGKNVLVVEDNEMNRIIVKRMLEKQGVHVELAENGKIACDKFNGSKPGYFSSIVMDIQMPEMNGYEATRCIRKMKREDAKSVKIVALSANAFQEDIEKSIQEGMNAHCAKPIQKEELLGYLL